MSFRTDSGHCKREPWNLHMGQFLMSFIIKKQEWKCFRPFWYRWAEQHPQFSFYATVLLLPGLWGPNLVPSRGIIKTTNMGTDLRKSYGITAGHERNWYWFNANIRSCKTLRKELVFSCMTWWLIQLYRWETFNCVSTSWTSLKWKELLSYGL